MGHEGNASVWKDEDTGDFVRIGKNPLGIRCSPDLLFAKRDK